MYDSHSLTLLLGILGFAIFTSLTQIVGFFCGIMGIIAFSFSIYDSIQNHRRYNKWKNGGFKKDEKDQYSAR